VLGAIRTAKNHVALLDAVTHNSATAMIADRRKSVNGALERIEGMLDSFHLDGERFVVVVSADFAFRHDLVLR